MRRRATSILGLLLAAMLLLPGCEGDVPPRIDGDSPRVVSFAPSLTAMMFDMGLGSHVVGVTTYCRPPEDRPVVGSALSIRTGPILSADPDVVLTNIDLKEFEPVQRSRPDVRFEFFRVEKLDDIPTAMERIGHIVEKPDVGTTAAAEFRRKIDVVSKRAESLPKKRAMFALWYENASGAGEGTFLADMINLAGGTNVLTGANSGWSRPTLTDIAAAAPEVIICQCLPGREEQTAWYWLALGRRGGFAQRVVVVTDPSWTVPSGHQADLAGMMVDMLHAETPPPGAPYRIYTQKGFDPPWWLVLSPAFRMLAAAAVGMALAIAGLALQGLLRNPLAEPYILGISSGAGVGVLLGGSLVVAAVLPIWLTTPILAMVGALGTAALVYAIAQRRGRLNPYVLLLSGVIVNVFNGAVILTILQFVKQEQMINFIGWGMGQIPEYLWYKPELLVLCWVVVLGGAVFMLFRGAAMNTLGLGDEVAASSGVSVHRLRISVFAVAALMTAAAVALAGPIGFVGLIVPHICRLIFGPDHRRLVVACAVGGALLLTGADLLCQVVGGLSRYGELPVGVITALAGGPFFIFLLHRRAKGGDL